MFKPIKGKGGELESSQNSNCAITQRQFRRLLESGKGSYEVCQEFFKNSTMLEDKSKIADIATKARWFARGRKNEGGALKYLFGQYAVLGSLVSAAAVVLDAPAVLLAWIPHTIMTLGIAALGIRSLPYASKFPPLFNREEKLIKEVQSYLEYQEFAKYKVTLGGNERGATVNQKSSRTIASSMEGEYKITNVEDARLN